MANKSNNTLLQEALTYYRWGWSIIPIPASSKAARVKWKKYQSQRPDKTQIQQWFSCTKKKNIAVILGKVSGGLVCRDFDKMDSYLSWAENHPELVKTLPIVQTGRGMHVYFLNNNIQGIKHFDDGELRASGGYCLLPPSIHPDGSEYEWVVMPNGSIPEIDPVTAGLTKNVTEQTENTEQPEKTEQTEAIVGNGDIEKAINETLPKEFGTRNRMIFEFARTLQSLPQFFCSDPNSLKDIVKQWHKRALPKIRTKEFEETWIDFLKAWPRVKYKKGEEPIMKIFNKAIKLEQPKIALEKYPENKPLQILTSLCRELQRASGDNPFFLAVRTAGSLLGVSHTQADRWLFLLENDNVIKTIVKGGTKENPRKATRFKYIADL